MVEFRQILCPTDLSEPSARALAHAAAIARWYDAKLTVLYVVPTFDPMLVPPIALEGSAQTLYPPTREEVLASVRRFVERAGAAAVAREIAADSGQPAGTIVDRAGSMPADLIVMGTHGRSGFDRVMIGSVAEKVLRKAVCPVLVVPPHAHGEAARQVRFKTILCPVDFSSSSVQALGLALDLARQADGTVILLHAIEWLAEDEPRGDGRFNMQEFRQYLADDARRRLHALAADEPRTWSEIQEVVTFGRPHREVLRIAEESKPDLIVMGVHGRGALGLALFGSTTHQVVRAAPCPVLTVRSPKA
ncbi:MAG: universal stress protein [Acidobacteria bacterium]|nr:universal stress protein [Acidobacteriota bacterium]